MTTESLRTRETPRNGASKAKRPSNDVLAYPRVTVRLTGDVGNAIQEIQDATSAATPSEVIRRAILVYHTLVRLKRDGNEPIIEVRSGSKKKSIPIFL
jgi:hypothetical protein